MNTVTNRSTDITQRKPTPTMCQHQPPCPSAESADREAAHPVAHFPEQGWSLLCNGVLLFEDTGELLPDGKIIDPHRPQDSRNIATVA